MSVILRKWLASRLGIVIDYDLSSFEDIAQDGTLIAGILYNYGVITYKNFNQIIKTYDINTIKSNLAQLRVWLQFIGIDLTEKEIRGITYREKLVAARLFYQLYVILNSKSKTDYFTKNMYNPSESPSQIIGKTYNACEINELSVSPLAREIKGILLWQKNRYKELMERCKTVRTEYGKKLDSKIKEIKENKLKSVVKPESSYLVKTSKVYSPSTSICKCKKRKVINAIRKPDITVEVNSGKCVENMTKATNYINYLKHKHDKCYSIKKIHKQLNKMILLELMNNIVDKEDREFKEMITSKLLKQSYYEKQMTVKLIDIRNQKYLMLQNLQHENKKIMQKKEQEFTDQLLQQKENLTRKEKQFIENKLRQFELHKRLWTANIKKEYKLNFNMCYDIMKSIADLAVRYSEYRKEYGHEVTSSTWGEWCLLFRGNLDIFDYVQDTNLILNAEATEEDEELTLELYRQNGLDICDFNDYLQHYGAWQIVPNISHLFEDKVESENATNILGYIVHKLLLVKYPKPEQIPTPVFPPADIRAAVVGVTNQEIVTLLQKTLTNKEIIVVDTQTVVDYCIRTYLSEKTVDAETEFDATVKKNKKSKNKPEKANKKGKKGTKKIKEDEEVTQLIPKETQTPRIFPCCEITLTKIGELGKYAYETLYLGQQINEVLMTQMLAEYLKNITYVKGFVVINFPETINEAYYLEMFYNEKEIPNTYKSEIDNLSNTDTDDICKLPTDEFTELRLSYLLPNPKPPQPDKYESFFTSFTIMTLKKTAQSDISAQDVETIKLKEFYDKLLICSILEYQKLNYEIIRDLVMLISKDVTLANKIYDELQELAIETTKKKKKDQASKEPKAAKEKKGKAGKKDKSSKKPPSPKEDKSITPIVIEEEVEELPKPGEILWEYINIPMPKELVRLLATTWQDIELIYINDFKELLFMKRVAKNQIIPYVHDIETHMQYFMERPDNKQEYLHNFQIIFNEIQTDLREDDEYKAELHFRVQEFRNKLWSQCDEKMKTCEAERKQIIEENWFTDHTINFINIYIKGFQLELDRCINTLQFLQDYYTSMIFQKPLEIKFIKQTLRKLDSKKSGDKLNYAKSLSTSLVKLDGVADDVFIRSFNNVYLQAVNNVHAWKTFTNNAFKVIETSFGDKKGPITKQTKKTKKKEMPLTELDTLINKNMDNLLLEWHAAIEGEIFRTFAKLHLLHEHGTNGIKENLYHAEYLFHEIYNRIQERYNDEVDSVDLVCQVFSRAIEACEPIQVRLIIDGAKFSIDDKKLFYSDAAFNYGEVKEHVTDYDFTIAQINMLVTILIDLAPTGVMTQKLFTFLLEDMLVIHAKDSYVSPLPYYWRYLKPDQVHAFIAELYYNDDYIDWKDFIIWNMLISYPTELEILDARQQFRNMDPDKLEFVNKQQFSAINFWFEDEYKDEESILRMSMFKDTLYKMFLVDEDKINYSALLLYFCKDEEALQGVIKALELAIGQLVCWDVAVGEKFVIVLRKQKAIEEEKQREALSAATSAVENIYRKTVGECISTFSFLDISEGSNESEMNDQFYSLLEEDVMEEEICDQSIPSLCYFLKWPVLVKVMTVALPRESQSNYLQGKTLLEKLEDIYCSLRNPEFDNKVLMHEFLNNDEFIDIINMTTKFLGLYPSEIVRSIIEICTCEQVQ